MYKNNIKLEILKNKRIFISVFLLNLIFIKQYKIINICIKPKVITDLYEKRANKPIKPCSIGLAEEIQLKLKLLSNQIGK